MKKSSCANDESEEDYLQRGKFSAAFCQGKNGKGHTLFTCGLYLIRQRPTLPHTFACSTIGPAGLNFRVRDGNGWGPRGVIAGKLQLSAVSYQLPTKPVLVSPRSRHEATAKISKSVRAMPHN